MKQERLLWYGNRKNCTGFPSEHVGFECGRKQLQVKPKGDKEAP